jgi:protein TonB
MKYRVGVRHIVPAALATWIAALVAACSSSSTPPALVETTPTGNAIAPAAGLPSAAIPSAGVKAVQKSNAANPRAYRQDAAHHLYDLNHDRIYKGKLPPMLYAIGVLQVDLDGRGNVRHLNWMRAPKHAPEVVAEIERTVRAAAPFPAPARMGKVVYTDTWLWHKSGRFQLDTLTEGQL